MSQRLPIYTKKGIVTGGKRGSIPFSKEGGFWRKEGRKSSFKFHLLD